ncbi:MAG: tetratricopeptide repeat protein [Campylobacterales bacterium]|nr:tetratricopeptide repeat protein [Campylobacterales bacterium]
MSAFQFFLLLLVFVIFYKFFKQLFSGEYPKRGVDFEAKREDENIGNITSMKPNFNRQVPKEISRLEELKALADAAIEKEDYLEAQKALQSALIVQKDDSECWGKYGFVSIKLEDYKEAQEAFEKLLEFDKYDDMAHAQLANVYHKLGRDEEAISHHKRSIELDSDYAPHYFNYANTLHDLEQNTQALELYKKAYEIDNSIEAAKEMIEKLSYRR